jgi:hypothetical protein
MGEMCGFYAAGARESLKKGWEENLGGVEHGFADSCSFPRRRRSERDDRVE